MNLFNGKGHCTPCHGGPAFSDQGYHNIGVGMDQKNPNLGREAISKDPRDRGRFKTPSLRNCALTNPYLHDGSEKTLADVIAYYDRGGIRNPNLDPLMLPLKLTQREKADLVAFLEALTGTQPDITPPELPEAGPAQGGDAR
jgi:cytochrome c peroxidase